MKSTNWREVLKLMFVRDWPWKVLSLVIASLLYFSIRSQISHVRPYAVSVDVVFDAAGTGVAIESIEPRSVQVKLRGSNSGHNQLNPDFMLFEISPKRKKKNAVPEDLELIKLTAFQLRNSGGLRVVDIEPSAVWVRFDVPMNKQFSIAKPQVTGTARGKVKLTYEQTHAMVTGSRRLINELDPDKVQVMPAPIDVEGRTQSFQPRVALYPPGDPTRLKVVPTEMIVNVQITIEKATTRIENVPVHLIGDAAWVCMPATVTLEVEGNPEEIANARQEDFSVIANATGAQTGAHAQVPLTVLVRQGTTMTATAVPAAIELTLPPEQETP